MGSAGSRNDCREKPTWIQWKKRYDKNGGKTTTKKVKREPLEGKFRKCKKRSKVEYSEETKFAEVAKKKSD